MPYIGKDPADIIATAVDTTTGTFSGAVSAASVDADGDVFNVCDECDDSNADVQPYATEVYYDGIDQNCDGLSDYDADLDGYLAYGYRSGDDCDDENPDINPGAEEIKGDFIDQDCDGIVDNIEDTEAWTMDFDNDGFLDLYVPSGYYSAPKSVATTTDL